MQHNSLTASAAVILSSLSWSQAVLQAAPHPSPSADPKAMFKNIDSQAEAVAQVAFHAGQIAKGDGESRDSQMEALNSMRDDVNKIGSELRVLESEKTSLNPWEVKALQQTATLMRDAADNTDQAIRFAVANPQMIQNRTYIDDVTRVTRDADEAASMLTDYLKLDKTQEKELRLEHRLGTASGF